jgi:hypothetical protein
MARASHFSTRLAAPEDEPTPGSTVPTASITEPNFSRFGIPQSAAVWIPGSLGTAADPAGPGWKPGLSVPGRTEPVPIGAFFDGSLGISACGENPES